MENIQKLPDIWKKLAELFMQEFPSKEQIFGGFWKDFLFVSAIF